MEYYVIDQSGNRYGPARVDELNQWILEGRVDPSMIVEEVGSGTRFSIRQVPGVRFASAAPPVQGGLGMGGGMQAGGGLQYGSAQYPRSHVSVENHLVKAILATICCCLPIGVVAIVYAAQVDGHANRGDYSAAHTASTNADLWGNWSIGLGLISAVLGIALGGLGG